MRTPAAIAIAKGLMVSAYLGTCLVGAWLGAGTAQAAASVIRFLTGPAAGAVLKAKGLSPG